MFVVLLLAVGGLGYGVAAASGRLDPPAVRPEAAATATVRTPPSTPGFAPEITRPSATASSSPQPAPTRTTEQVRPATGTTAPASGTALLAEGDDGPRVRELQSRLRQLDWFFGDVTDHYGPKTTAAVRGFQGKRGLPETGDVDATTLRRLEAMTHAPTADELANKPADGTSTSARLDDRCRVGRALCVDKSSRTVRWVVDGHVLKTMAVRFGASYTPTREGLFSVQSKSRDHVSSLYDTPMPFAMFFSGGQAVHYSPDFAQRGYAGASHGCVNVRDREGIRWLFDQVEVGDKVVIYWS